MTPRHISVLLHEVIDGLDLRATDTVIDGTANGGGHSQAISERIPEGLLIACDQDEEALKRCEARLGDASDRTKFWNINFREIPRLLTQEGIGQADKLILDLGLSSNQLDESGRGFTFQKDEPLAMTFHAHPSDEILTARDIVNTWSEENLATIFRGFGEEKFPGRIARAIVEARAKNPIERTGELVEIIKGAIPAFARKGKIHPATRVFQALRIATNDELGSLEEVLKSIPEIIRSGGRVAIISFHSIEDRIVKNAFRSLVATSQFSLITKKPIVPTDSEIALNPRARSAKLRIIQRI